MKLFIDCYCGPSTDEDNPLTEPELKALVEAGSGQSEAPSAADFSVPSIPSSKKAASAVR